MTKKKTVMISLVIAAVLLALAAIGWYIEWQVIPTQKISDMAYLIAYNSENEPHKVELNPDNTRWEVDDSVGEKLDIVPEKWDYYPFRGASLHHIHMLNYMIDNTVVMKDGTEYDAYYYPHDDAFSIFGMEGYYVANEITHLNKY